MAITTFMNDSESQWYTFVRDSDLNVLFQEIREMCKEFYLQERTIQIKRFLRKPIHRTLYTLYVRLQGMEYQIINFASNDGKWSINTSVPSSYIYTYFYGYLNGMKSQIKETRQKINHLK